MKNEQSYVHLKAIIVLIEWMEMQQTIIRLFYVQMPYKVKSPNLILVLGNKPQTQQIWSRPNCVARKQEWP